VERGQASRTAVFVCQGRAVADGRLGVGQFTDPFAELLLSEVELAPVRRARNGELPADGRERFTVQSVSACAEVMAPRTVVIDIAVIRALERGGDWQVVLLGAGLDARPWRLTALRGIRVFSVDHPASQADLRRRAEGLPDPVCDLRFVAADLTQEPLGSLLSAAGHDPLLPTAWVWEGVIPYLSRAQVSATLDALTGISAAGSILVAQYQSRSLKAQLGRRVAGLASRLTGVLSPLTGEPWRSQWSQMRMAGLLADRAWAVDSDVSLLESATRLGTPTGGAARSLAIGRVAVARLGARAS
jgi:methyltransferase (TIGR00027 family)